MRNRKVCKRGAAERLRLKEENERLQRELEELKRKIGAEGKGY